MNCIPFLLATVLNLSSNQPLITQLPRECAGASVGDTLRVNYRDSSIRFNGRVTCVTMRQGEPRMVLDWPSMNDVDLEWWVSIDGVPVVVRCRDNE